MPLDKYWIKYRVKKIIVSNRDYSCRLLATSLISWGLTSVYLQMQKPTTRRGWLVFPACECSSHVVFQPFLSKALHLTLTPPTAWFWGKIDCLELYKGLFGCPDPWQLHQLHLGILLTWSFSTLNLQGCCVMTVWKVHCNLAPFRILTCMFCFPLGITLAIIPSCCRRGNYWWVCCKYSNSFTH